MVFIVETKEALGYSFLRTPRRRAADNRASERRPAPSTGFRDRLGKRASWWICPSISRCRSPEGSRRGCLKALGSRGSKTRTGNLKYPPSMLVLPAFVFGQKRCGKSDPSEGARPKTPSTRSVEVPKAIQASAVGGRQSCPRPPLSCAAICQPPHRR